LTVISMLILLALAGLAVWAERTGKFKRLNLKK